jgi:hypothetical protein
MEAYFFRDFLTSMYGAGRPADRGFWRHSQFLLIIVLLVELHYTSPI